MQLVRRYRIPALVCAFAVLVCELISRPYANMGVSDDGPYILIAQKLAVTGHIAFNGWSAAMLLWQLYLGAALIKLFGFSFTTVRTGTLLVAVALAFFLQRVLVRSGLTERNATIGTLAFVLSPIYLLLSATFMSDIHGLFGIVLCLYGCLRAVQSPSNRATIAWLCFAAASNTICGTSRQLAWLGVLVMVPSTVWLLRDRRRVFVAGAAATLAGVLFILGCMAWLKHQPYTTPETFHVGKVPLAYLAMQFAYFFLDIPFLLLPVMVLFLARIRTMKPRVMVALSTLILSYLFLVSYRGPLRGSFRSLLEPTLGDWLNPFGGYLEFNHGAPPVFLQPWMQILLTLATFGSLVSFFILLTQFHRSPAVRELAPPPLSWKQLGVILVPFTGAYIFLLLLRAVTIADAGTPPILDRYSLGLLLVLLVILVRYYQDQIQARIPFVSLLLIGAFAIYGVALTHGMFALCRARVALAAEFRAAGYSDTSIDNGWEYNLDVELQHARYLNNPGIVLPAHAYVPAPPPSPGACPLSSDYFTPHIHPLYGVSFDPNACYGPAPFAPVQYSRWPYSTPGTLYAVRYVPAPKP